MIWSLMLASVAVAQTSAVTPAQVSTLPPAELGRRLLGPTRLPIVQASLYGEPLEAPPPPGDPVVTRVMLYERASDSAEAGFCQKVRYMVRLQPVRADRQGQLPPAPTALVTPTTLYRWKTADGRGAPCEGGGEEFLSVSDSDAQAVFWAIRELAALQSKVSQRQTLQTSGTVDDEYGRQGYPAAGDTGPITNWRTALKDFPIAKISRYHLENTASGSSWTFRAGEWTVVVNHSNSASSITSLNFRRFIPPPA